MLVVIKCAGAYFSGFRNESKRGRIKTRASLCAPKEGAMKYSHTDPLLPNVLARVQGLHKGSVCEIVPFRSVTSDDMKGS